MSSEAFPVSPTRRAWASLASRTRGRRGTLAAGVACTLAASALAIVPPFVVGALIDAARDGEPATVALRLGAVIAAVSIVGALLLLLGRWLVAAAVEPAVGALREDVVEHVLHLDGVVVERLDPGDLVTRVADDARVVAASFTNVVPRMLSAVTAIVVTVPGLFAVDWRLGLAGLLAVPLYAHALAWYLPRSAPGYAAQRTALGQQASRLLEGAQAEPTVRAFGRWEQTRDRVETASRSSRDHANAVYRVLTGMFARNNRAEFVVMAAILLVGFLLLDDGVVSLGGVATAALLYHRLFNPLNAVVGSFDELLEASAALARVTGVLDEPRSTRDRDLPGTLDVLAADGITHRYGDGPAALHDVTLAVAAGELVALVGTSGAGKSTLAAAMAGTLDPLAGTVTAGGVAVRRVAESDLRGRVCLVTQDAHVFAGTIASNLRLGAPAATDDELWAALVDVDAGDWVRALADGLATAVGDDRPPLDPVEVQQLALARVLLVDPDFVILDEAGSQDGASGSRVLERAAGRIVRGRGALVVAHRLSQARPADRIVVLEHGRIVEQGGHDDLVARGGRYAHLWRAWAADGSAAPTPSSSGSPS